MTKFQSFYENVRIGDSNGIQCAIEEHVSKVTFLNWKKGRFEPDSRYWGVINDIAERFGYSKPYTL